MAGRMSPGWSLRKTLDKMLLVIINIKGNKRFPNFFSSHRIMFVSLWAAQSINYFLWAFLWLILSPLSTQVVSSRTLRRKNCTSCRACVPCYLEKKVQQSWQTSALGMHLPLARLVSTSVIFCLLPSSNIVILVFYLFSTDMIREQHVWELWVWSCERSLLVTHFNAKWPFKVIYFGVGEEPLKGCIVQYNNFCGLACEGSEDRPIASERSENSHLRRPHYHLTTPLQRTHAREYPHKFYLSRN